jgi:hypothetical protein
MFAVYSIFKAYVVEKKVRVQHTISTSVMNLLTPNNAKLTAKKMQITCYHPEKKRLSLLSGTNQALLL